jgi:hypothetical protein
MSQPLLMFAALALQPPPIVTTAAHPPAPTLGTGGAPVVRTATPQALRSVETVAVRITSPEGLLWEGSLRVGPYQNGSYNQSISQASDNVCPREPHYDRAERSQFTFGIYAPTGERSAQNYRIDASWARPVKGEMCVETGTRTVQMSQMVSIAAGETKTISGDAGFRVQLSRAR